ncbi:unnamed protein product [Didymodactylos carnosus]|uniref:Uncharacterized protein n=1 Tax=Didymodactylos carnosus TaxID=1234261 RepID=A0A8S2E988_9BILA|nr:unnamed protein product [Didymodactylos carnosus]CAF3848694.1 unnamed protein product [Didymodactylos carnosus]
MKCFIPDEQIESNWDDIVASLGRQEIDDKNNLKKKVGQSIPSPSSMLSTTTPDHLPETETAGVNTSTTIPTTTLNSPHH